MSIRVLVVDDSAFMRKFISEILNSQADIQVVAVARNGEDALQKLSSLEVDVVTLDVEMPILDGLETLQRIMDTQPLPVLMLSSMTKRSSQTTFRALALGAVDFISKPTDSISSHLQSIADELISKVRTAATAVVHKSPRTSKLPPRSGPQAFDHRFTNIKDENLSQTIIAIGASTGGPKAVEEVLSQIPPTIQAGIVLVQHMPRFFTRSFAERLNSLCPLDVKEAEDGDVVQDGRVLVAPGDYHMTVDRKKRIRLNQDAPVMFLRPSINVTMLSLPEVFGSQILGVVLTGMGRDGADGMAEIKRTGGWTIAQDVATSTIPSMPRAVAEAGNADYVLPISRVGESIVKVVSAMTVESR